MTPTQAQDLKRLAEAAPPGPWKFGISEWEPDTGSIVQVKPFDYNSGSYSDNPYIFDAKGNTVVGCDEYDVFSGAKAREYLTAMSPDVALSLLAERAMLLDMLDHFVTQYEEGTPCYESPEDADGYIGNAFKVDDEIFSNACEILNKERPRNAAIAQCEGNHHDL